MFRQYRYLLLIPLFEYYLFQLTFDGIAATGSYNVTRDECINANGSEHVPKSCCKFTDMDDEFKTCIETLHLAPSDNDDNLEQFVKLSIIVECVYKKKKYIRSGSQLNMSAIKADAKRLYKKDSVQKKYLIEMYKACGKYATDNMENLRSGEEGLELMKKAHHPYFSLVFACTLGRSYSNCPYFRWKGTTKQTIATCKDYADQCKKRFFKSTTQYLRSLNGTQDVSNIARQN